MKSTLPSMGELSKIAQSNPEELERIRAREIETIIRNAKPKNQFRLRGLQFQIDCERKRHKSPLGACIAISRMMFSSVSELQKALHDHQAGVPVEKTVQLDAKILPFERVAASC